MIKGTVMYWNVAPHDTPFVKILDAKGKFVDFELVELNLATGRAVVLAKDKAGRAYVEDEKIVTEIVFFDAPLEVRFQDPRTPWLMLEGDAGK